MVKKSECCLIKPRLWKRWSRSRSGYSKLKTNEGRTAPFKLSDLYSGPSCGICKCGETK